MIIIPACLRCEHLEKAENGIKCKFHPDGIPREITLAHKLPKEACSDFKSKYEK